MPRLKRAQREAALCVAALPVRALALADRRQRRAIDAQLDGALTTLVNALRARPSATAALAKACPLFPAPLRAQVEFSSSQMRVGSSLEEALLDLGLRVRSQALDAAIVSLLFEQKVGGRLPEILETVKRGEPIARERQKPRRPARSSRARAAPFTHSARGSR